jgi:3-oxoacyl-[acyl-carrier protein] reductase
MSLQGKVVVVTGSAQGIGRYIAHTFATEGARVVVNDLNSLDNVMSEIKAMDAEVLGVQGSVRDEDDVRSLMQQAVDRFGRIDVLVNNAGIVPHFAWGVPRWAAIKDMEKSFWDTVLDTNLGGTFLCTKHAISHMEKQGSGHIINLFGGGGGSGAAAYVTSKYAIRYFTQYVAAEEKDAGLCIVVTSPGGTIAHEAAPEEARQRIPGTELIGNRFVLAAEAPMEMSGHLLDMKDGALVIAD